MGRFKVGYCGKRRSLLGRLFEKNLELTPATTLPQPHLAPLLKLPVLLLQLLLVRHLPHLLGLHAAVPLLAAPLQLTALIIHNNSFFFPPDS